MSNLETRAALSTLGTLVWTLVKPSTESCTYPKWVFYTDGRPPRLMVADTLAGPVYMDNTPESYTPFVDPSRPHDNTVAVGNRPSGTLCFSD